MLKNDQTFYVYEPTTGAIRYTVDAPAPKEIVPVWQANGEAFVIAAAGIDVSHAYVDLLRASVFTENIIPHLLQHEEKKKAMLQLIANADVLRGKVEPYQGYEIEKVPADILAAADALMPLQESIAALENELADLMAAIDTHTYENGSPVIARPTVTVQALYNIACGGEEAAITLPRNTSWAFTVDGQDAGMHTDEFTMSADVAGEYIVLGKCWPYEDIKTIVRAA